MKSWLLGSSKVASRASNCKCLRSRKLRLWQPIPAASPPNSKWCFSIRATLFGPRPENYGKIQNGLNPGAGVFRSRAFDWNGLHKKQPMLSTIFWSNAALQKKPSLPPGFYCKINQSCLLWFYCRIHLKRGSDEKLLGYLKSPAIKKYHKRLFGRMYLLHAYTYFVFLCSISEG